MIIGMTEAAVQYLMRADPGERMAWALKAEKLGAKDPCIQADENLLRLWAAFITQELCAQERLSPVKVADPEAVSQAMLPVWGDGARGAPNDILRSALFAAIQGKTRRFIKDELVATVDGVSINFHGEQLDQSDFTVWHQVIHLVRTQPLSTKCSFIGYYFLKYLDRTDGTSDYEWLRLFY